MKVNRLLAILLIVVLFCAACSKESSKETFDEIGEEAIAVEVAEAKLATIEREISYSGRVKPIKEIMVIAKQPGKVSKINFELGDSVKAGQLLFQLDKKDAMLQLKQAAAAVELAEINLKRMSGSSYEQQLLQLEMAMNSAGINYNDAKKSYENIKALYEAGAESKFNHDRAKSQLDLAEQQYESAKTNYKISEEKSFLENIEIAQVQLNQSKAAYDIIQNSINDMDVRSPINGIVSAKNIKVGEFVSNANIAFIIIDNSSFTVEIDVSEEVIGKLKAGDSASISINSISQDDLAASIIALAPSADLQKQTYLVKILIEEATENIKGGMFAEIRLTVEKEEDALLIPLSSVVDEEGEKFVFIAHGDKALKREVSVGIYNDKEIQIIDGISVGDIIVVRGQDFLKDGSNIVISNK